MSNSSFYSNTGITSADVSSITSAKEAAATSETNAATSATEAATSATQAATSATNAASSETNVSNSAATATTSAANASTSETNASASAATATTQASNAATSATAAAGSASTAGTSATNAASSATNAATSETNAATSETNAANSATSASTSATNAGTSETNAAASASAASGYVTSVTTQANNAATSATAAATSETNAASSATAASTSASGASTSASNANTSATNAASSASQAASSAAAAALAADNFDDTYLGSNASDPTTDNDGDALNAGDLHFNTTSNTLKVYNGSAWQDAAIDSSGFVQTTGDTMTGDLSMGDNVKAIFGAGSDLQIYHTATGDHSVINESGGGDLQIQANKTVIQSASGADDFLVVTPSAGVQLSHNASGTVGVKLATTSTGVDVTGTLTVNNFASLSSTTLTIGGEGGANGVINSDESIYLNIDSNNNETGKVFRVGTDSTSTGGKSIALFSDNGDISFYEDTGTTAKFFWDASAESLGIGTSSPATTFDVRGVASTYGLNVVGGGAATGYIGEITNDSGAAGSRDGLKVETILSNSTTKILTAASNSIDRFVVTGDGNVGIGTSSPARTLHLNGSDSDTVQLHITNATTGSTSNDGFSIALGSDESGILNMREANPIRFFTSDTERMRITSAGSVGIGTSSPASTLHVDNGAGTRLFVGLANNIYYDAYDHIFRTSSAASTSMTIANSGNVGIGTSSPSQKLEVSDTAVQNVVLRITNNDGNAEMQKYQDDLYLNLNDTGNIIVRSGSPITEAMRIDSSGNLLVGTTDSNVANNSGSGNDGVSIQPDSVRIARTDGDMLLLNRLNSDGDIAKFLKDGSTVGSIASRAGLVSTFILDPRSGGAGISSGGPILYPTNESGALTNGNMDFGAASYRWKDLYLSGSAQLANITNGAGEKIILNSDNMVFQVQASEAMRINSSGHLLISTTSDIVASKTCTSVINQNNSTGFAIGIDSMRNDTSTSGGILFRNNEVSGTFNACQFFSSGSSVIGSIVTSNTATAYNTSSDHRLKENVVELTGATTRFKQLEPKRFNFIADADTTVDGFLAHEVQSIVPEAITGTHNEVDADGNPVYQGIDQSKLVPLLVATIKELEARITALENA